MKKTAIVTCSALLLAGANAAYAQSTGFQGANVTLSYGNLSSDLFEDITLSSLLLEYEAAYNFTPALGVQFGVGIEQLSVNAVDGSADLNTVKLDLHGYYNVSLDVKVGVFVTDRILDHVALTIGGFSISQSLDVAMLTYGAEVSAKFGQFSVAGYVGTADLVGDDVAGFDADTLVYGADLAYDISPQISLNAEINVTDISNAPFGGGSVNLLTYVVGAEYAINNNLTVMANLQGGSLDIDGLGSLDLFGYGVGVDYVLPVSFAGGGDITFFGRVGTTELTASFGLGSEDVLNYQIGATWSFGGGNTSNFFEGPSLF